MDAASAPFLLWGKARGGFHPLICHMLDVAAVARALWRELPAPIRHRLAERLAVADEELAGRWVAFWAGLHDIGKGSPAFALQIEAQVPAIRERLEQAGFYCPRTASRGRRVPHGTISAWALRELLPEFGLRPDVAGRVATVVGGRHGVFPRAGEVLDVTSSVGGSGRWAEARRELSRTLATGLGLDGQPAPGRVANAEAMFLAGFVSVADWIGSNATYFAYRGEAALDVAVYAVEAERGAGKALRSLLWSGWSPPEEGRAFESLFRHVLQGDHADAGVREPNVMQREAVALGEELQGPGLVIIEAPMGEGKTEAAMYLADRWATALGQRGCYFALPTQATSNQMFGRVRAFLEARYGSATVNLMLLHGHAALSAEFEVLRRRGDALFEPQEIRDEDGGSAPGSVVAGEWFTHRKRGLLAPFGVGTVDQALLAVLQTRHVFVRLFGLAHKTVIIDEVHAYDTYMTALLERLLEWLAALGCSVVLLSATLPRGRREALARAYLKGIGAGDEGVPYERYPRLTWAAAAGAGARHVEASALGKKVVALEWVDGRAGDEGEGFELGERLRGTLAAGGCAAVICNTVGRAQEVYRALKPYFPSWAEDGEAELDLLHARFLYEERRWREERAEVRFGKPEGRVRGEGGRVVVVRRPRRAVLVATQVIEQSLDLDFDLMVTEMAPVDLVLQRAGRLHRHERERPAALREPELWICRPEVDGEGVPRFGAGTEAVYDGHVLLRSWLAVGKREVLRVPEDVEDLIEDVYADRECPPEQPEAVRGRWADTRAEHEEAAVADAKEAEVRWVKSPSYDGAVWRLTADPREEDAPEFHQAHQALTRLGEPTVSLVCLFGTPDEPCLDPGGKDSVDVRARPSLALAAQLLRRSVSVSDRRLVRSLLEEQAPAGWQRSPLLRHHRLLTLDAAGCGRVGRHEVCVDDELGLRVSSPGGRRRANGEVRSCWGRLDPLRRCERGRRGAGPSGDAGAGAGDSGDLRSVPGGNGRAAPATAGDTAPQLRTAVVQGVEADVGAG